MFEATGMGAIKGRGYTSDFYMDTDKDGSADAITYRFDCIEEHYAE